MKKFLFLTLLVVLMGCGHSDKDVQHVHFGFEYADDIKKNTLFDTQAERDAYKSQSLQSMEKLFSDFYKRFGFKPEHEIHVTLSERVKGGTNSAFTTKTYDGTGKIVRLSMHFPYEMFEKKYVRAHELTHAFVAPFFLPTWADEGFAVLNENYYSDTERHAVFSSLQEDLRTDGNGINAVQNWTEGQGIYADFDLTIWCYRYSHTIVKDIEKQWPGTFQKYFALGKQDKEFTKVLDSIIKDYDMTQYFKDIKFER